MSDELPEGWVMAALAQLTENPKLDIISGPFGSNLKSDEYVSAGVPIVRLQNVDRGKFLEKNMRFITPQKAQELSAHNFRAGDIVITKLGDPLGKACAIPESLPRGIVVADVVRVRIDESRFSRSYILSAINSPAVVNQINSEMMGSTRPRVNLNNIRDLKIPIAPLAEQRRIVAKLETLLGKVEACQQRLAKIPRLLKRFRQSVLAAACSGRLTTDWREKNGHQSDPSSLRDEIGERRMEIWAAQRKAKGLVAKPTDYPVPAQPSDEFEFDAPESWERCSMDALTSVITSGSRDWKQYYGDHGSGTFIMAQNVRPLRFDRSYRLAVAPPENDRDRTRSEVCKDDLLVTIVGANTGDCCRVPEKLREHYVCQSVALMRPVMPATVRFLELFLNSTGHGLAEWRKWIYGEGRPHLSFDNLRETLVCLPPLSEQHEIVRRVEQLFTFADQLEARFAKAQAYVDKLKQSLLAKAFRGELVPQDPNDEPASALLARIRSGANGESKLRRRRATTVA